MEEGEKRFKRDKLLQKGMVLSVCFRMEMIHFTIKDKNFHKSKDVQGTVTLNLPSNNE